MGTSVRYNDSLQIMQLRRRIGRWYMLHGCSVTLHNVARVLSYAVTCPVRPPQISHKPVEDMYVKERMARLELELQAARKKAADNRTDAALVSGWECVCVGNAGMALCAGSDIIDLPNTVAVNVSTAICCLCFPYLHYHGLQYHFEPYFNHVLFLQSAKLRAELSDTKARLQELQADMLAFDPATLEHADTDNDAMLKQLRGQVIAYRKRCVWL